MCVWWLVGVANKGFLGFTNPLIYTLPMDAKPHISPLERLFLRYFGEYPATQGQTPSRSELATQMLPIERGVIWRGGLAGFLSGLAAAGSVYLAQKYSPDLGHHLQLSETMVFYGVSVGLTTAATLFEIAFLYTDAVKGCAAMSRLAQTQLSLERDVLPVLNQNLVRAGLELPNRHQPLYGIDPLTEQSKLRLLFFSFAYKLKVSATNILAKFVLRRFFPRLAGRTFGRTLIELASAPVFALWNIFLCRRIMRQSRVRALGPALMNDLLQTFFPAGLAATSVSEIRALYAAIKEAVVLSGYFHCNLVLFTSLLIDHLQPQEEKLSFTETLNHLDAQQQAKVLDLLAFILVLDGKLNKKKRAFFDSTLQAVGHEPRSPALQDCLTVVVQGKALGA